MASGTSMGRTVALFSSSYQEAISPLSCVNKLLQYSEPMGSVTQLRCRTMYTCFKARTQQMDTHVIDSFKNKRIQSRLKQILMGLLLE